MSIIAILSIFLIMIIKTTILIITMTIIIIINIHIECEACFPFLFLADHMPANAKIQQLRRDLKTVNS